MNLLFRISLSMLLLFAVVHLHAETITLKNGDQLNGEITSRTVDMVYFTHPVLGELSISSSEIADSNALTDEEEVAVSSKPAKKPKDSGFLNTGWLSDWKRQLSIGIIGAAGKSDNQKINVGFTADFEDKQTRLAHKTVYYRYESEGDLEDHNLFSSINRDWLLPESPHFYFAGGRIDLDEFEDWDQRLAVNGGVGYEFIDTQAWRLLGRAGIGVNQTFGGVREETTLEGLLGIQLNWKINSHQSFAFSNTFHPSFDDTREYRNLSAMDWDIDLNEQYRLGLKIGLTNEYDSLSEENSKNDFKYNVSILLGL